MLFLDTDGTAKGFQKISATAGGGVPLDPADNFGSSVALVGDLDSDGVPDAIVGAIRDDDGASDPTDTEYNAGAAYVLFLNSDGALPVELASFTARADGPDAVLTWQTRSETNNAGFAVETRVEGNTWREVGFVGGAGTTTEARTYTFHAEQVGYGTHAFRLQQVDFDGTPTRSEAVEVTLGLEVPYAVAAYPNPVRPGAQATVDVAVRAAQDVTVAVYDVLGRRVRVLHDGPMAAQATTPLAFEAAGLASGVYLVRVTGERFSTTRRLTLVR